MVTPRAERPEGRVNRGSLEVVEANQRGGRAWFPATTSRVLSWKNSQLRWSVGGRVNAGGLATCSPPLSQECFPRSCGTRMLQPTKQSAWHTQVMCDCALLVSHRGHGSVTKWKSLCLFCALTWQSPDTRDSLFFVLMALALPMKKLTSNQFETYILCVLSPTHLDWLAIYYSSYSFLQTIMRWWNYIFLVHIELSYKNVTTLWISSRLITYENILEFIFISF